MKTILILLSSALSAYIISSVKEDEYKPASHYFAVDEAANNESFVKVLDLSSSGLNQLPREVESFVHLQKLGLADNNLTNLTGDFSDLQELEQLDLSGNVNIDLRKSIPALAESKNLRSLLINGCDLFFLPNNIELLKNLEYLDMSDNYIMEFPYYMSKLTNLKYLDASNNNLFELGYAPSLLTNLEYINLKGNDSLDLENTFLALSFLKNLTTVEVSDVEEVPKNIKEIHCEEIVFENSRLKNIPKSIEENTSIREITVTESEDADIESVIDKIDGMEQLDKVHFTKSLEKCPKNINKLSQLTELDLSDNGLNAIVLKGEDFPRLSTLNISGNDLSEENIKLLKSEFPDCRIVDGRQQPQNKCAKVIPPFENLDVAFDSYTVANNQPTTITHENSEILIPENAFLSASGEVITTPVEIEYREFQDPLDVLFSGIPMGYDSAGVTYNLETSGMIEFRAFSEGKEVFANPKAPVQVNLGSKVIKDGYNIYQLDDATGEWKYQDVSVMLDSNGNKITAQEIEFLKATDTIVKPMSLNIAGRAPEIFPENQFFSLKKIKGTRLYKLEMTSSGIISSGEFRKKYLTRKLLNKFDLIFAGEDKRGFSRFLKGFNKAGKIIIDQDYGYFKDTHLELDKEKDQFNFVAEYTDTTLFIPVYVRPRLKNIEKEQKFNLRFWKQYKKLKKKEKLNQLKEERKFRYALKEYEIKNVSVQNTNRANISKKRKKFRPLGLLARPISILSFGIINTDCYPPVIEIETELQQIEMIASGTKEELYPDKITVINKAKNSFRTYNAQDVPFENARNSSLMVMLKDGRIGYINSNELKPLLRKGGLSVQIPLTVVDPEEVSLTELRKMILA